MLGKVMILTSLNFMPAIVLLMNASATGAGTFPVTLHPFQS